MPLLVNKIIFSLVPSKAPFLLRPILRGVFSNLDRMLINPRLKSQADYVCIPWDCDTQPSGSRFSYDLVSPDR